MKMLMKMMALMRMMAIMPTWREEEVVGEAVHAARVLHEVGSHPVTVFIENGSRSRRSSQFQVKEKVGYENRHFSTFEIKKVGPPAIIVSDPPPVLLVPLATPQRRVTLLQLVAGTDPRLIPGNCFKPLQSL